MRLYTDPRELYRAEQRLFGHWKRYPLARQLFLPDGAMPCFALEPFRLLFVLKEGNDPKGDFVRSGGDLRAAWEWGYDRGHTWRPLAIWAAVVLGGVDIIPSR